MLLKQRWQLKNFSYYQRPWTTNVTKYIQSTKTKGTICHHILLQRCYTTRTKPSTRHPVQSLNQYQKRTLAAHHQQGLDL